MEKATAQADMGKIEENITLVRQYDAALADEFQRLADEFEYSKILALLQNLETQP